MEKENGGPAFPVAFQHEHSDGLTHTQEWAGMTLRDYFAGQAIIGIMSDPGMRPDTVSEFNHMAMRMYQVADAMLKAREKC